MTMSEVAFDFTEEEIQVMLDNLDEYTPDEVLEIDKLVDELDTRKKNKLAYDDLIEFCKAMQSDYMSKGIKTVSASIFRPATENHN
jgi:hypothetical protein